MTHDQLPTGSSTAPIRPRLTRQVPLAEIAALVGAQLPAGCTAAVKGVSLDSRAIVPGDLYLALPGAHSHGAGFAAGAVAAGAAAVLTDHDGERQLAGRLEVPVLVMDNPRAAVGAIAAAIYGTGKEPGGSGVGIAAAGPAPMAMFAVTGTNGKTTTTYFINSLLRALGKTTGLIGTIEILAGDAAIPSKLTTPESTEVHALLALMRERGLDAASMEVSSHALAYGRVDSVVFDVAGFTNLTQDHLDLHGSMEDYYATKARLFAAAHSRCAVITVDDVWGAKMAAQTGIKTLTLRTTVPAAPNVGEPGTGKATPPADWQVASTARQGIGNRFTLTGPDGATLNVHTGLPGDFNVSNAALAAVMVVAELVTAHGLAVEAAVAQVQEALDAHDPFTVDVPGRMQLVGQNPTAIVDFAHNPDALVRALTAVRTDDPKSKVIVVFGATGERDATKRPTMGAVAAEMADVVIVTDDDPHGEDPAGIRADVLRGALAANAEQHLGRVIEEVGLRADAIVRAVELARSNDTILVAGRGHEVHQEVKGINVPLDDRVELRAALARHGFCALDANGIES